MINDFKDYSTSWKDNVGEMNRWGNSRWIPWLSSIAKSLQKKAGLTRTKNKEQRNQENLKSVAEWVKNSMIDYLPNYQKWIDENTPDFKNSPEKLYIPLGETQNLGMEVVGMIDGPEELEEIVLFVEKVGFNSEDGERLGTPEVSIGS